MPRFNAIKPARVDIDRDIKPLEVWKYQPKTVFLGTSRIHQSIDASLLQGTPYAPAYNAAIPAGSLASNIANLEQYKRLDPNLKTVFIELFLWNFLGQDQTYSLRPSADVLWDIQKLFVSGRAVFDSVRTVRYNLFGGGPVAHIARDGHYVYAPNHNPAGLFAEFPEGIRQMEPHGRADLHLYQPAFASFAKINAFARSHGIRVVWIVTPEHAYVDQWIESIGGWDVVEEWLRRLAKAAPLYSFSQPNRLVYENVSSHMQYWYDPFHFTPKMGADMLRELTGRVASDLPKNFLIRLTPENIGEQIEARRRGIEEWGHRHQRFVGELDETIGLIKLKLENIGEVSSAGLTVDGRLYKWARRTAGSVESAKRLPSGYLLTGWAVDARFDRRVKAVVAAIGAKIVKSVVPDVDRSDIRAGVAPHAARSGYRIIVPSDPTLKPSASTPIRIFALMQDGVAVELASKLSAMTAGAVADAPFVQTAPN